MSDPGPASDPAGALDGGLPVGNGAAIAPLRWEGIPADARLLVDARRALEDWALAAGIHPVTVSDIVLASYEAMANAAEHAYRLRPGTIDLLATRSGSGDVHVTVRDRGDWRVPPSDPGARGRGLLMIRSVSSAEIEPGPHGTTVVMRWSAGA